MTLAPTNISLRTLQPTPSRSRRTNTLAGRADGVCLALLDEISKGIGHSSAARVVELATAYEILCRAEAARYCGRIG